MKRYSNWLIVFANNKGFTLIELLTASVLTGLVISGIFVGVLSLMGADKRQQARVERQTEISRALDLISQDIRDASAIKSVTGLTITPASPSCAGTSIATPIFRTTVLVGGNPYNRVFFVTNMSGCDGSTTARRTVWNRPALLKVVRENSASPIAGDPPTITTFNGNLGSELVDGLIAPTPTPTAASLSCNATGQQFLGADGLYICIESPRSAVIYMYGADENGQALPAQSTRVSVRAT
ncbi:MAG: prepilin-type N-terminal cleavage/methylation domain-containing protein [Aphanocapsa sp. GSE-SYN-MK-11-07L]|jgi:type II secretory pathway pseudopilin PulG|nr:prepilin-type N-terminal cleavage/methylation domain-containing protein [Aphanocapsa sp. GSE-SYN-MK-11-07L]